MRNCCLALGFPRTRGGQRANFQGATRRGSGSPLGGAETSETAQGRCSVRLSRVAAVLVSLCSGPPLSCCARLRCTRRRHGLADLLKTYIPKVCLQRAYVAGRDDRADIAVGTHQNPIAGSHSIAVV